MIEENLVVVPDRDPKYPGLERWRLVDNIAMQSPDTSWNPPHGDKWFDDLIPREHTPDECMWEFAEMWRAKWYHKIWYGLGCWFRTGKWPIRVWVIPRKMKGHLNRELYEKIYTEVSKHPGAYVSS